MPQIWASHQVQICARSRRQNQSSGSVTPWGVCFTVSFTYRGSFRQPGPTQGFGVFFPSANLAIHHFLWKTFSKFGQNIFGFVHRGFSKKRRINIFQKKHFWRKNMFLVNIIIYCWETILMEQFQPATLTNCSSRKKSEAFQPCRFLHPPEKPHHSFSLIHPLLTTLIGCSVSALF